MEKQDFPALYRDADSLSLKSQKHFFKFLKIHICALVVSAILSIFNSNYWWLAIAQCVAFLFTLSCSIYLFKERPDRDWYAGRALAESIKTLTWRYICRAEPFQDNEMAQAEFRNKFSFFSTAHFILSISSRITCIFFKLGILFLWVYNKTTFTRLNFKRRLGLTIWLSLSIFLKTKSHDWRIEI